MTTAQQLITIGIVVLGTMATRFLPFIIWPEGHRPPALVTRLGHLLPAAVMGLLVVYSLRHTNLVGGDHGLYEALALLVTALVHLRWRNMMVSIACGTLTYMALVQGWLIFLIRLVGLG